MHFFLKKLNSSLETPYKKVNVNFAKKLEKYQQKRQQSWAKTLKYGLPTP